MACGKALSRGSVSVAEYGESIGEAMGYFTTSDQLVTVPLKMSFT